MTPNTTAHQTPDVVKLAAAFSATPDDFSPRVAVRVNAAVTLTKLRGEFLRHHHDDEDELLLVVRGRRLMRVRDRDVWIEPGEF